MEILLPWKVERETCLEECILINHDFDIQNEIFSTRVLWKSLMEFLKAASWVA